MVESLGSLYPFIYANIDLLIGKIFIKLREYCIFNRLHV